MAAEKRIGVAIDFSEGSNDALSWAVENLVEKGDHLILVIVLPEGHHEQGEMQQLWKATGSPLIPILEFSDFDVTKKYGVAMDCETLDIATQAARLNEAVVLMKVYWGDAREKLCEAVDDIPLDSIVIGNRGLGKIKRVIMGSVSNHVVNHASCPVTVVKKVEPIQYFL